MKRQRQLLALAKGALKAGDYGEAFEAAAAARAEAYAAGRAMLLELVDTWKGLLEEQRAKGGGPGRARQAVAEAERLLGEPTFRFDAVIHLLTVAPFR